MRKPSLSSVAYAPTPLPVTKTDLRDYLMLELNNISASIRLLPEGNLDVSYVAPSRPRDGMLRIADGTHWDPGSGAGLYYYQGGAWHKS